MKVCLTLFLVIFMSAAFPAVYSVAEESAPQAVKDEAPLFAVLLGGNEVSDEGDAAVGDPDGRGSATVLINQAQGSVCFGITVSGLTAPTAAHIHQNVAGHNGTIVIPFTQPATGNPGSSSGCITVTNKNLLKNIKTNPSMFYVNVHTSDFPGGAIRGQLN
jgi:CHRD domain-containing protein